MSRPQPLSPPSSWGIEGSRLHHWLPRPSRVPNFHRARFKASTLCLIFLRLNTTTKGCWAHHSIAVFITKLC
jgi:hypothetical protein